MLITARGQPLDGKSLGRSDRWVTLLAALRRSPLFPRSATRPHLGLQFQLGIRFVQPSVKIRSEKQRPLLLLGQSLPPVALLLFHRDAQLPLGHSAHRLKERQPQAGRESRRSFKGKGASILNVDKCLFSNKKKFNLLIAAKSGNFTLRKGWRQIFPPLHRVTCPVQYQPPALIADRTALPGAGRA